MRRRMLLNQNSNIFDENAWYQHMLAIPIRIEEYRIEIVGEYYVVSPEAWYKSGVDNKFYFSCKPNTRYKIEFDSYCEHSGVLSSLSVGYTDGTFDYIQGDIQLPTTEQHFQLISAENKTISNIHSRYRTGSQGLAHIKIGSWSMKEFK